MLCRAGGEDLWIWGGVTKIAAAFLLDCPRLQFIFAETKAFVKIINNSGGQEFSLSSSNSRDKVYNNIDSDESFLYIVNLKALFFYFYFFL